MEAIKINRKDRIMAISELGTSLIAEEPDRLLIVFKDRINYRLAVGQYLAFRRYDYGEDEFMRTITALVEIIELTEYNGQDAVYTTIPGKPYLKPLMRLSNKVKIKRSSEDCVNDYDAYFDDTNRYLMVKMGDDFEINDWLYYYNDDNERFVVQFGNNHNIFQQDIFITNEYLKQDYTMVVKKDNGNVIGTIGGVQIPIKGVHRVATSSDTLTEYDVETCGKIDGLMKVYKYTHTPDSFSRNSIIFTKAITSQVEGDFFDKGCWLLTNGGLFESMFTPYYFYTMDGTLKKCVLWYDQWWNEFNLKNGIRPIKELYVNSGDSRTIFGEDGAYWRVSTLSLSHNELSAGAEGEQLSYVDEVIDRAIPPVIDTERFKYIPVIIGDNGCAKVKSLIFDFHFRERAAKKEVPSDLAIGGSYPIYEDGWYVDSDSGTTVWWNGMDNNSYSFNSAAFSEFYNASGKTSDLLGYLGFDDEDVLYRKSKLGMSFIRLSFYTSKDPIEQKLLYYSTCFLDATNLEGKAIKQSLHKYGKYGESEDTPLVFFPDNSVSARLDTEICIKNEMNTMSSSEGFNLYLFGDDAEKKDEGKPYRTIYMKVEFNHAGNGKTIPMIMWPKDRNGNFRELTVDTFLNDLYIPVQIGYIDDKFVYSLPTVDNENGNLRLILFEPKLCYTEDGDVAPSSVRNALIRGYGGWGNGGGVRTVIAEGNATQDEEETESAAEVEQHVMIDIFEQPTSSVSIDGGGSGSGDGGDSGENEHWSGPISNLPSKSGKRLYFGAYSVNTFYGRRLSLPVFLRYPSGRPTSKNYSAVYSINGKLRVTSSNPSVIDLSRDNYTPYVWLYNACDRYTLPAVVHIGSNNIKGVGSAVIKIELIENPEIYDTCIVNVSNANYEGVPTSSFAQRNLVYPWETYVRKDAFFDIWGHHRYYSAYEVSIDDETGVSRQNNGGGIEDSLRNSLQESTHSMAFKALKAGDYTITFTHPSYSGTAKARIHVIDE